VLLLALICTLALSACDDNNQPQTPNNDHVHAFGEWSTVKKATCTVKGEQERSCSCGEKETQSIDATGHTEAIDAAVAATCTTDGKTEGKHCSVCSETLIAQNNIPASHTDGEWVIDTNATCIEDGSKHQVCAVCSTSIKTEKISATGHTAGKWVTDTNATCTEDGSKHQECSVCSTSIKTEKISATGHADGEWITDTNATCTVNGSKHQVCSVCNDTIKIEVITAKGHDCSETLTIRDCANPAKINYACSRCSYTYEELVKSPKITLEHKGTSSATMNGYGRFSFSYTVTASDGYGKILYKYELFGSSTATVPATTIDFTEETSVSVSYTGYEYTINEYIYKISAKDEAGNLSIYWFKLEDCSVMKTEDASTVEHSYENKTCVCGRDVTADAIATYDLSKNQDGSVIGYLTNINGGQKLYILGRGEMKNYSNITSAGHTLTPFEQNENITEVYVGEGITSIGDYLFYFCTNLKVVNIPQGITYIGSNSFYYCSLTNITLPEGLLKINNRAFHYNKLTNIAFPETLEYIGDAAFYNCSITSVHIPKNVSYIGEGAFLHNNDLCEITVDENNATYHSSNNCIINTSTKTLVVGCKDSVIPIDGSVLNIGNSAFSGCTRFTSIIIPDSVTSIGDYAFSVCTSLTSVTIPDSVTSIGVWAFYGCRRLTSIIIPDSVTSIDRGAFYECEGLESVTFENTIGWKCGSTNMDVTNSATNAANLTGNYSDKWTRS